MLMNWVTLAQPLQSVEETVLVWSEWNHVCADQEGYKQDRPSYSLCRDAESNVGKDLH